MLNYAIEFTFNPTKYLLPSNNQVTKVPIGSLRLNYNIKKVVKRQWIINWCPEISQQNQRLINENNELWKHSELTACEKLEVCIKNRRAQWPNIKAQIIIV